MRKNKTKYQQNRTKWEQCNNGIKHLPSQFFDQTSQGYNNVATTAAQKTSTDCQMFLWDLKKTDVAIPPKVSSKPQNEIQQKEGVHQCSVWLSGICQTPSFSTFTWSSGINLRGHWPHSLSSGTPWTLKFMLLFLFSYAFNVSFNPFFSLARFCVVDCRS